MLWRRRHRLFGNHLRIVHPEEHEPVETCPDYNCHRPSPFLLCLQRGWVVLECSLYHLHSIAVIATLLLRGEERGSEIRIRDVVAPRNALSKFANLMTLLFRRPRSSTPRPQHASNTDYVPQDSENLTSTVCAPSSLSRCLIVFFLSVSHHSNQLGWQADI